MKLIKKSTTGGMPTWKKIVLAFFKSANGSEIKIHQPSNSTVLSFIGDIPEQKIYLMRALRGILKTIKNLWENEHFVFYLDQIINLPFN